MVPYYLGMFKISIRKMNQNEVCWSFRDNPENTSLEKEKHLQSTNLLGSSSFLQSLLKISIICFFQWGTWLTHCDSTTCDLKNKHSARLHQSFSSDDWTNIRWILASRLLRSCVRSRWTALKEFISFDIFGPTRRCYIFLTYHLHKQNTASSFFGTNVGEIKM